MYILDANLLFTLFYVVRRRKIGTRVVCRKEKSLIVFPSFSYVLYVQRLASRSFSLAIISIMECLSRSLPL